MSKTPEQEKDRTITHKTRHKTQHPETRIKPKIDTREITEKIEKKYKIKLPPKPTKTIYDPETDTLYIEYQKTPQKTGEPTKNGELIIYYDKNNNITAIETLYTQELLEQNNSPKCPNPPR